VRGSTARNYNSDEEDYLQSRQANSGTNVRFGKGITLGLKDRRAQLCGRESFQISAKLLFETRRTKRLNVIPEERWT